MRPTDVFNPSDVLRPTDWFAIELAGSDWSEGWEKFNSGMVDGVVVGVALASTLITLELPKSSSYTVDVLPDDWSEALVDIDLSINILVGEWIDVLARV